MGLFANVRTLSGRAYTLRMRVNGRRARASLGRAVPPAATRARLIALVLTLLAVPGWVVPSGAEAAAGTQSDPRPLATNLEWFAEWNNWAFVDAFRMSSPWISGTPWRPDSPAIWNDGRPLDLDDRGWVRSLRPNQIARTTMLWGPLATRPAGHYVVLYDGRGQLGYGGSARLISSRRGRDVISVSSNQGIELQILRTNPNNYIRNIRVIMPGGIYADDPYTVVYDPDPNRTDYLSFEQHYSEIVFHPDFLSDLRGYQAVRFMNWMLTNVTRQRSWSDRPQMEDAHWTLEGPPLEVMIDLANRVGFDPWFNIPHQASNTYVRKFARMVRDLLRPDLTAYVEYSNEVWNTTFRQHAYAEAQGLRLGLDTDPFRAASLYYARRATQIFIIWEDVFGDPDRFIAVAGAKLWDAGYARTILDYGPLRAHSDVLAIGGYFGFEATWPENCSRVSAMTSREFGNYVRDELVPAALNRTRANAAVARERGIPLIVYEGGQHFTTNPCYGNRAKQRRVEALFDWINRSPRIKRIYLNFLRAESAAGVVLFTHYHTTGKWTADGRFGAREHFLQTRAEAPKYAALQIWMGQ